MKRFFFDKVLFLKELILSPRLIGSIIPSSKFLARSIVQHIPKTSHGYIVELGGGTGAITKGILAAGIDPERLVIIEISPRLVTLLKEKFPNVTIIEGSAEHLDLLLKNKISNIDAIVSSLPLKSLPKNVVKNIMTQIKKHLPKNGIYIQYTYAILKNKNKSKNKLYEQLTEINSKIVWRNVPPATVHVMKKT